MSLVQTSQRSGISQADVEPHIAELCLGIREVLLMGHTLHQPKGMSDPPAIYCLAS